MKKKLLLGALLALPLAVVGVAYGQSQLNAAPPDPSGFTCPMTGEELPCPDCCPLNGETEDARASADKPGEGTTAAADTGGYICPLNGEELPCPNCCPAEGQ